MNADDIIQQKQWNELSEEEKSFIAEIAADEQEFNLLKKMMKVSLEENEELPTVNPLIREKLRSEITAQKSKNRVGWYIAAAAIAGLLIFLFTQNKKEKPDIMVKTNPDSLYQKLAITDSSTKQIPELPKSTATDSTLQIKEQLAKKQRDTLPQSNDINQVTAPSYSNVINPSVDADTSLMAFITEVY